MSEMIYRKNAEYLLHTVVCFEGAAFTAKLLKMNVNKVYNMLQGRLAIPKTVVWSLARYCEVKYDPCSRYILPPNQREICQCLFLKHLREPGERLPNWARC